MKIDLHVMNSENSIAVDCALECLRLFGINMDAHPSHEQLEAAYRQVWSKLGERSIESLIDLPRVTDPEVEAAMRILAVLYAPAAYTDETLIYLHLCELVSLTLDHGITDASVGGFGWFGILLSHVFGKHADGYQFGRLARDLVEKHGFNGYRGKSYYTLELVSLWKRPISAAIDSIRTAFTTAVECGDVTVACYSCNHLVSNLLVRGDNLDGIYSEVERGLEFAQRAHFTDVVDILVGQQRYIENMRGRTRSFSTFDGPSFSEIEFERGLTPQRMATMMFWYWVIKAQARFMSGDYYQAVQALDRAKPLQWSSPAHIQLLDYHLFSVLIGAAGVQATVNLGELKAHERQLVQWSVSCPETFSDKCALVGAEIARVEGRDADASRQYENAIRLAGDQGFVQMQGLAFELAARFYENGGFERFSRQYMSEARYCYSRWGAAGKARQLDELYPYLVNGPMPSGRAAASSQPDVRVDIDTVVKMSRAVSADIVREKVIKTLMGLALEHAGADRGLLVRQYSDESWIEAEALAIHNAVEVRLRDERTSPAELPVSVLLYVIRTAQSILLDDSAISNEFSDDQYFASRHIRSMLCLPLVTHGVVSGVLYLENSAVSHAFTPVRDDILRLLVAQAAISFENAELYKNLADSEDRFRLIVDTIPTMAWVSNAEGVNEVINKQFLDYTGLSMEQALASGWTVASHPDDRTELDAFWRSHLASGETGEHEARLRCVDGRYRWFLTRVAPFRDTSGTINKWYGIATDIEQRKQSEDAARASQRTLQMTIDTIPGAVWCATPDGEVEYVSERYLAYAGGALGDLAGAGWQRLIHPDDADEVVHTWTDCLSTGRRFSAEYRLRQPDGSCRWFKNLSEPLRDSSGHIERWYGLLVDVDDRKRAEQELQRMQGHLARATQLATAGELAGSIAHEVSQPLMAVLSSAEAALQWISEKPMNLTNARHDLERIVRDASDAGEVVKRFRTLFKRHAPAVGSLPLNEIITEVVRLLRSEIIRRRIVVEVYLDESLPASRGDRLQIQQVVLNLVLNAIEAMDTVSDRPRRLIVRSRRDGDGAVVIEVRDYGIGMKDPERIYESFFTTKENGIGMGLSICKSIVEAHQGRLWTEYCEGPGARFCFTLTNTRTLDTPV